MTPVRPLALLIALSLSSSALAQTVSPATVAPAAATAAAAKDDLPPGAPRDDYEFVGWCAGVLTGHMALYEQVQPTLKQISKRWNTEAQDEKDYAAQQVVGRDLLEQFAEAMKAAERASTQAISTRGTNAIAAGREKWSAAATVDANARAYSWLNWGLPERCERVAAQLKSRSNLMSAVLRDNSKSAVQASAVRAVGERPKEDAALTAKPAVVATAEPTPPPPASAPVVAPPAKPVVTPTAKPPVATPAAKPAAQPAAKPVPKPAAPAPAASTGLRGSIKAD